MTKRVKAVLILLAKGVFKMRKKPPEIDFGKEEEHLKAKARWAALSSNR